MAKQLYWRIKTGNDGCNPHLPPGLGCLEVPDSLLLAYVSDSADPDGVLLDASHADVFGDSVVRGRRVAPFVVKLVHASYDLGNQEWNILLEYDESALADPDRELTHCDICQIECLTCDAQAKVANGYSGTVSQDWLNDYGNYLTGNPSLGACGLDVLS